MKKAKNYFKSRKKYNGTADEKNTLCFEDVYFFGKNSRAMELVMEIIKFQQWLKLSLIKWKKKRKNNKFHGVNS